MRLHAAVFQTPISSRKKPQSMQNIRTSFCLLVKIPYLHEACNEAKSNFTRITFLE
jgi:hypothetical protein